MNIVTITDRTPALIEKLTEVWEGSVKATHLFLSDAEISAIKQYVPEALKGVPVLITAEDEKGNPLGFMGISGKILEMLFLAKESRGQGIGKKLLQYGMERYGVSQLAVNEQNPAAKGFYEYMGFTVYKRTEVDEQGQPYPLLYMRKTAEMKPMRAVNLFIAMSLDGYIADADGKVDWLKGQSEDGETIDSYAEFIKDIDTVLMGWNTYHQIVTELSPGTWVYDDLTTYVLTHREMESTKNIRFTNTDAGTLVRKLKSETGNGIWICGGAGLVRQLIKEDLIDIYYITVIPTLLGEGIRLFEKGEKEIRLQLLKTRTYNGMAELVYSRRAET